MTIQEVFVSSYFDVNDYSTPVHYFLDDFWVSLDFNRSVVVEQFIKRNTLQLFDNLFGIFDSGLVLHYFSMGTKNYFTADPDEGPGPGVLFV